MFKISIIDTPSQRRLVVEGRLSEPWVAQLCATWRDASRELDGRKLVIDLSSLTVISREGEEAIFDLMKRGAKFSCAGILTRHVLKGLARRCRCTPSKVLEEKKIGQLKTSEENISQAQTTNK
ncbi:MAG: hypothetical protein ABSG02_06830 [Terriglobales bacterium]|jgi:hypothetical protein